jgi:hypothetical protein
VSYRKATSVLLWLELLLFIPSTCPPTWLGNFRFFRDFRDFRLTLKKKKNNATKGSCET